MRWSGVATCNLRQAATANLAHSADRGTEPPREAPERPGSIVTVVHALNPMNHARPIMESAERFAGMRY